ncbi:MAG: ZIP family metal transporter [Halobacteriaceae archaeon]
MVATEHRGGLRGVALPGVAGVAALVALTASTAALAPAPKLLGISWVAFAAMAGAAAVGARADESHPRGLVWGYGLASGAMVTSAAVFLVPGAIGHDPQVGGFGIAAGLLAGFAAHTGGHRLTHRRLPMDRTTAELTAHALAAGAIIGAVYTAMPGLGPLLGLAIVSHKGPAGYAAARRLSRAGRPVSAVLLPASGVGIAGLAVSLLAPPGNAVVQAAVFGFAAGVFLHVAMDFLPRCETGSEVHEMVTDEETGPAHARLDRLRVQAVASTLLGALAVFGAWAVVA